MTLRELAARLMETPEREYTAERQHIADLATAIADEHDALRAELGAVARPAQQPDPAQHPQCIGRARGILGMDNTEAQRAIAEAVAALRAAIHENTESLYSASKRALAALERAAGSERWSMWDEQEDEAT